MWSTTKRSWEMKRYVRPKRRLRSIRRFSTWACTETSRADTGSSATIRLGWSASAAAIPIRQGVHHGLLGSTVGGGEASQPVGSLHGHPELVGRVRRIVGEVPGGRAARGHDLDVVGPLGDQLADDGPDRLEPVGDAVAPPEMPAAVGDGSARQEEPGTEEVAPADRLADDESDAIAAAVVAEGCHPAGQVALEVPHRDERHHLVGLKRHLLVSPPVRREGQVRVGIDEPGEERPVGEGVHGHRPELDRHLAGGADGDDAGAVHDHHPVLDDTARTRADDPGCSHGVPGPGTLASLTHGLLLVFCR
jgi:hypothetical protein